LLTVALVCSGLASSTVQAKAPKGRYTIANGEVTDTKTGLVWKQALNPGVFTFDKVDTVCTTPWRVPNVKELASIVDESTAAPSIDEEAFPGTPVSPMWSSTPDARDVKYGFAVDFTLGGPGHYLKTDMYQVRCVK
jgi:hypothetical protein